MPRETMTPRERWLAVLTRQPPDRVPMDYWATPEVTEALMKHLGCGTYREAMQKLHIDYAHSVVPRYVGPDLHADTDAFGCRFGSVDYGTGTYSECVHHPLAQFESVEEIEKNYTWPSPDWWDYSDIREQAKEAGEYPIRGGGSEPFLLYKYLRGDEQAYIDLLAEPEIAHYILDKLFDLAYENTRRIFEQIPGRVIVSYVAEDLGGQTELMISKENIHEFLLPRMKRIIDLAHEGGAFVFHHDDGNCRAIIPDMIEVGIDVLNPIQWRCQGMEREGLKRDFGDKVIFHGGVDNQQTIPFGTADDVRREVEENLKILGAGGGYILAPCHNIQPVTPVENIVALYDAGYEMGWRR